MDIDEASRQQKVNERNLSDDSLSLKESTNRNKTDNHSTENVNTIDSNSTKKISNRRKKKTRPLETSIHSEKSIEAIPSKAENKVEVQSISDEDDVLPKANSLDLTRTDYVIQSDQQTMVSSFTTGAENDVIEIHQFSENDIDSYLDLYFETLDNRLKHHIGGDEQILKFRNSMRTRIKGSSNAREYHNVLLGKINDEVVAAATMLFAQETPTIPLVSENPSENTCFKSIKRWLYRNANYYPKMDDECYIEMIGVNSSFQNRGIGAAMLQCVEHFAQQAGAAWLTIHVDSDPLRIYFERFGFEIDHGDSSAFWKWIVERKSTFKLRKQVPDIQEGVDYSAESFYGESVVDNSEE